MDSLLFHELCFGVHQIIVNILYQTIVNCTPWLEVSKNPDLTQCASIGRFDIKLGFKSIAVHPNAKPKYCRSVIQC